MNTWFKKLLQALGIIRGDLDALLGHGASFASKLDAHAAQALDDAKYHYDQSAKHDDHGDDAHDEYVRATKVAQNVRALFAV